MSKRCFKNCMIGLVFLFVIACGIYVNDVIKIFSKPTKITMNINETKKALQALNIGYGKIVSSDPDIIKVSENDVITSVNQGITSIDIINENGESKSYAVEVKPERTDMEINASAVSLEPNDKYVLETKTESESEKEEKFIWESSDSKVAIVKQDGTVIAKEEGVAVISSKDKDDNAAYCIVEVKSIPVESIESISEIELNKGNTKQITFSINPSNATNQIISYSSENNKVATVSKEGLVTAKGIGVTTITLSIKGEKIQKSIAIKVTEPLVENKNIPVTGVTLSKKSISIQKNKSIALSAIVAPSNASNQSIVWSSSDKLVATVDQKGNVIAKNIGTVIISATSKDGSHVGECNITVTDVPVQIIPVESLKLTAISNSVFIQDSKKVTIVTDISPKNASDKKITWKSSNDEIASVDKAGVVSIKKIGSVTITATTSNNIKATYSLNIKNKPDDIKVSAINVSTTSLSLIEGKEETVSVAVSPTNATNKTITWSSTNPSVAAVNNGIITAKKSGEAQIIATAQDGNGIKSYIKVVVSKPAAKIVKANAIALNTYEINGVVGSTHTLTATVNPFNTTDKSITWSTSNANVATVSDGKVQLVGKGIANITVNNNASGISSVAKVISNDLYPLLYKSQYPTSDIIVADISVIDKGADKSGVADSTKAFQAAIDEVYNRGGGTVIVPSGFYKLYGSLNIKDHVTLRGDYNNPDNGSDYGTVIYAYNRSASLFLLTGSAGVNGLTIFYPEQDVNNVIGYPATITTNPIYHDSMAAGPGSLGPSITNITILNGYIGVDAPRHTILRIEGLKGTLLNTGIYINDSADVDTITNVNLNSMYWANSKLNVKGINQNIINQYTTQYGVGIKLGAADWSQFSEINISNYKIGIEATSSTTRANSYASGVAFYKMNFKDCATQVSINNIDETWGMVIADSLFLSGAEGIMNRTNGVVKLTNTGVERSSYGTVFNNSGNTSSYAISSKSEPLKVVEKLYVFNGNKNKVNVTNELQNFINQAQLLGGGIVYVPAGQYVLNNTITIPSNIELRGSSSSQTVEQRYGLNDATAIVGTIFLVDNSFPKNNVLIQMNSSSKISGIRIQYLENSIYTGTNANPIQYNYAINGNGSNIVITNMELAGAFHGINLSNCDNHYVKNINMFTFYRGFTINNCKNGYIENVLQNPTLLMYSKQNINNAYRETSESINALVNYTKANFTMMWTENNTNQQLKNIFAFGVNTLASSTNNNWLKIVNAGMDFGGSNLLIANSGYTSGINLLAASSIATADSNQRICARNTAATVKLYNMFTRHIANTNEPNVE